jgi:uncharacterized protein YjbJ (UPF0337 family)
MGLWSQRRGRLDTANPGDSVVTGQDIDVILIAPGAARTTGVTNVNKNQVKGAVKDVIGKVQEEAGRLVGSKEQQIKGLSKQVKGNAQKNVGDFQQAVEELKKS